MMMLIDTMIDMMIDMAIDTISMRVPHQLILIHSNQLNICLAMCLM